MNMNIYSVNLHVQICFINVKGFDSTSLIMDLFPK